MFSKCKIVRSSRVPTHQSPAEMLILIEIIHHDHQLPGRIPHYSCCVSRLVFPGKTAPDSCTVSAMLSVSTPFHSTLFTSSLPARWSPPPSHLTRIIQLSSMLEAPALQLSSSLVLGFSVFSQFDMTVAVCWYLIRK